MNSEHGAPPTPPPVLPPRPSKCGAKYCPGWYREVRNVFLTPTNARPSIDAGIWPARRASIRAANAASSMPCVALWRRTPVGRRPSSPRGPPGVPRSTRPGGRRTRKVVSFSRLGLGAPKKGRIKRELLAHIYWRLGTQSAGSGFARPSLEAALSTGSPSDA